MVLESELFKALILAVVQGLTEWFPVSSSGHLVLFEYFLDYEGSLLFETALHFGTLMAVFVYFGKEITDILRDFLSGKWKTEHGKMAWLLLIGSIPAGVIGFLIKDSFEVFRGLGIVAFGFGITGLFLLITSTTSFRKRSSRSQENYNRLGKGKAFLVGIAQAFAIIPGVSRSGATISSGVLFGLSEKNAMKFAFLLSIPVIFGANIVAVGNQTLPSELIWATLVSFFVGLISIHFVFKYVLNNRKNFRWFGIYCLLLSIALGIYSFLI
jgi:undecaprenyl-diphosphatase